MATPSPAETTTYLLPQSVIPRGLAYLIDTAAVAVLTAVLMAAGVLRGGGLETLDASSVREMLESNAGLAVYAVLFGYFTLCEGIWGQTIGKRILGLRVVRARDGSPCGWARSVARNLIRPIDLFFAGLPGAVIVMFSPLRQRAGDMVGGTLVVRRVPVPPAMAPIVPGLLRQCSSCGRLAPAAGPCPACSAPAPAEPRPAGAVFGAVVQPLAGMMAVGEVAGALRLAAQEVLAAESAFGAASAAESARLGREGSGSATAADTLVEDASRVGAEDVGESAVAGVDDGVGAVAAGDAFVHMADVPDLSEEYVAAWRQLMAAVETLRDSRADIDAAVTTARVSLEQVTAADPVLRRLLEKVGPYLEAADDEAVLAAFMARAAGAGTESRDGRGGATERHPPQG